MLEGRDLLALLQHGDSFFPSGAVSFSWGVETLVADGKVTKAKDVERFVAHQLSGRWAASDRPVLLTALAADGDLAQVASADRVMEANNLAAESRKGSSRMGGALLNVHVKLETRGAKQYQARIRAAEVPGHARGLLVSQKLKRPEDEAREAHQRHGDRTRRP